MNKPDLERERILLKNAKSDKNKFDELYKYFLNDVYRFSYSILNNQHDAEDITSQTFIEFYKKLSTYKWQDKSIKSWFFITARNLSYKKFRKKDHILEEYDDSKVSSQTEYEISFVDQIMNLELVEEVKKEIQSLTTFNREIVNLRIWEGMSFKEIANIQASSESIVKKRFYRAVEKVKSGLESKGIRSIVALPLLFTAIKQVGSTPAYAAPIALSGGGFNASGLTKLKVERIMENTNKIFSNKLVLGIVTGILVLATIGITVYTQNTRRNQLIEYKNEELGFKFQYPSNMQLKEEKKSEGKYKLILQDEEGIYLFIENLTREESISNDGTNTSKLTAIPLQRCESKDECLKVDDNGVRELYRIKETGFSWINNTSLDMPMFMYYTGLGYYKENTSGEPNYYSGAIDLESNKTEYLTLQITIRVTEEYGAKIGYKYTRSDYEANKVDYDLKRFDNIVKTLNTF